MSTCPFPDCYDQTPLQLQPYGDISGTGVIIGFVGTAYLVLLLVVANYAIAFDPAASPFEKEYRQPLPSVSQSEGTDWWRPNPVDVLCIRGIQSTKLFGADRSRLDSLQEAFNESILALCDVQIVTGLRVLISGFILLRCSSMDAYHWQIIVYLAWFSTVTHLSGLTVLRSYLSPYPWAKYVRYVLMLCVAVLLFVAAVPTGFFDWSGSDDTHKSAAMPASYAICYLNLTYGYERYEQAIRNLPPGYTITPITSTAPWQAMVFSLTLLGLSFATRSIKLFRPLSKGVKGGLRKPLSNAAQRYLLKLASFDIHSQLARKLWLDLAVRPAVAVFLMLRLIIDMFGSVLCEIYWLLAILLWGTAKLIGARSVRDPSLRSSMEAALAEESRWTFGQLLPVILLIGPVLSFAGTFALYNMQHKVKRRNMQRPRANDVSLDTFAQNDDSSALQYSACSEHPQQAIDNSAQQYPSEQHPIAGDGLLPSSGNEVRLLADPGPFLRYLGSYESAPWLPACVIAPCIAIFAGTCMAFFTAFDFGRDFIPQFTLYEVWIGDIGLIYLLILGYPSACVVSILLGFMLERWLQVGRARAWRKFGYLLCCVAVYGCYFGVNVIWMAGVTIIGLKGYAVLLILSALFYCIYFLACLYHHLYGRD